MKNHKLAKVLTIANNKGGCGKSLIAMILADYCVTRKLKTLIIDLDPQTNLSRRFVSMEIFQDNNVTEFRPVVHPDWSPEEKDEWPDGRSSSADIWLPPHIFEPYPSTRNELLSVLPANSALLQRIELVRQEEVFKEVFDKMRIFLATDGVRSAYDIIIIDTRPSKGPLTSAAIRAATHVLIPSEMEVPSIEGLIGMLSICRQANQERGQDDELKIVGILPNRFKGNTIIHKEHLAALKKDAVTRELVLPYMLSDRVAYKEAMVVGSPSLFDNKFSKDAAKEATKACKFIIDKVVGDN